MRIKLLIAIAACAALTTTTNVHAAPATSKRQMARIRVMGQDKNTWIMMIHELMSTKEGKQEMAKELENGEEFRAYYETHALNPG